MGEEDVTFERAARVVLVLIEEIKAHHRTHDCSPDCEQFIALLYALWKWTKKRNALRAPTAQFKRPSTQESGA